MQSHHASQNKFSAHKSKAPTSNFLASRPFAVQAKPEETERSHPTQGYESQMPDFAILNPDRGQTVPVQPKLAIGAPGDKYEQEADHVAKQVVQRINVPQSPPLQRQEIPEDEKELQRKPELKIQRREIPDDEDKLQMKPMLQFKLGQGGMVATPELESSIQRLRGSGQPLADTVREPMEQVFGADFSGVKVHTDSQSDQLNQSIQAKAFTTGQDIFFRQGAYEPGSHTGQELLAHELTHVVQQNGANQDGKESSPGKEVRGEGDSTTEGHSAISDANGRMIQRQIGAGGRKLVGRLVTGPKGKRYKIIQAEFFRGKECYIVEDRETLSSHMVASDDPNYHLIEYYDWQEDDAIERSQEIYNRITDFYIEEDEIKIQQKDFIKLFIDLTFSKQNYGELDDDFFLHIITEGRIDETFLPTDTSRYNKRPKLEHQSENQHQEDESTDPVNNEKDEMDVSSESSTSSVFKVGRNEDHQLGVVAWNVNHFSHEEKTLIDVMTKIDEDLRKFNEKLWNTTIDSILKVTEQKQLKTYEPRSKRQRSGKKKKSQSLDPNKELTKLRALPYREFGKLLNHLATNTLLKLYKNSKENLTSRTEFAQIVKELRDFCKYHDPRAIVSNIIKVLDVQDDPQIQKLCKYMNRLFASLPAKTNASNLNKYLHSVNITQHIQEMFQNNPWLDVVALNEVNNPDALVSDPNLRLIKGPHIVTEEKDPQSDTISGKQNEYYSLVIRRNGPIEHLRFFCVDNHGEYGRDNQKEIEWNKDKKGSANQYRPIVVHEIIKHPKESQNMEESEPQKIWLAIVHTTPEQESGVSEWNRTEIYAEIDLVLGKLSEDAEKQGIKLIIGGDYYLSHESVSDPATFENELSEGDNRYLKESNKRADEYIKQLQIVRLLQMTAVQRQKLLSLAKENQTIKTQQKIDLFFKNLEELATSLEDTPLSPIDLIVPKNLRRGPYTQIANKLNQLHKLRGEFSLSHDIQQLGKRIDMVKESRKPQQRFRKNWGITAGQAFEGHGLESSQALSGTNSKNKKHINWYELQIADFFTHRGWEAAEVGLLRPQGQIISVDAEDLRHTKYWHHFSDHYPVAGLFSLNKENLQDREDVFVRDEDAQRLADVSNLRRLARLYLKVYHNAKKEDIDAVPQMQDSELQNLAFEYIRRQLVELTKNSEVVTKLLNEKSLKDAMKLLEEAQAANGVPEGDRFFATMAAHFEPEKEESQGAMSIPKSLGLSGKEQSLSNINKPSINEEFNPFILELNQASQQPEVLFNMIFENLELVLSIMEKAPNIINMHLDTLVNLLLKEDHNALIQFIGAINKSGQRVPLSLISSIGAHQQMKNDPKLIEVFCETLMQLERSEDYFNTFFLAIYLQLTDSKIFKELLDMFIKTFSNIRPSEELVSTFLKKVINLLDNDAYYSFLKDSWERGWIDQATYQKWAENRNPQISNNLGSSSSKNRYQADLKNQDINMQDSLEMQQALLASLQKNSASTPKYQSLEEIVKTELARQLDNDRAELFLPGIMNLITQSKLDSEATQKLSQSLKERKIDLDPDKDTVLRDLLNNLKKEAEDRAEREKENKSIGKDINIYSIKTAIVESGESKNVTIVKIPSNGNCGFEAISQFLQKRGNKLGEYNTFSREIFIKLMEIEKSKEKPIDWSNAVMEVDFEDLQDLDVGSEKKFEQWKTKFADSTKAWFGAAHLNFMSALFNIIFHVYEVNRNDQNQGVFCYKHTINSYESSEGQKPLEIHLLNVNQKEPLNHNLPIHWDLLLFD